MNRIVLFLSLTILAFSCSSQMPVPPKAQKWVSELANDSCFYSAGVGVLISDVKTGKIIAKNQQRLGLTTASTLKLVSTATALEILGENYRFKTEVLHDGKIENGKLMGNLIIKGYGDPTIDSKYFPEKESFAKIIAKELLNKNIHCISGKILCNTDYLKSSTPASWIWEDIGNYYGAVPHALSYHDNLYTLYFSSGKAGSKTKITKTDPPHTQLEFDNQVVSSSINRDLAYIFGGNTSNKRRIEGCIPQNRSNFKVKGALLQPELSLLADVKRVILSSGIQIEKKALPKGKATLLHTLYSPPLKEIVKITNQKSVNLFADHLLFEIGKQKNGKADWKSGIKAIKEYWEGQGVDTKHLKMFDGSGLSHFNAVSVEFFNQILMHMYQSKQKDAFLSSLPVAARSGTLKSFGKNSVLAGHWKAKTGSMTGVRSYAGYLTTKKGKVYAISIVLNNYSCSSSAVNSKILDFLILLYNS